MSRFTWAIVIGVLALIALSLVLAVTVRDREPAPDLSTASGVTLGFVQALQRGEPERAWDLLSSGARAQTTRERFLARAAGARSMYDRARVSVENERRADGTARVDLVRSYPGSGGPFAPPTSSRQVSTVLLAREGDAWRIETPPDPFLLIDR